MKVSQYLINVLHKYGVTDMFGIPGGVIMDIIYEADKSNLIKPHLNFHEQTASYAACGFAQSSNKIGVAYATKGPGMTNMITAIADAYCDSLPIIFITAHSQKNNEFLGRVLGDQEIDHISLVSGITKLAEKIDTSQKAVEIIELACEIANTGRKGPVLLDFNSAVLLEEIEVPYNNYAISHTEPEECLYEECADVILKSIMNSKRPVFLIGDGLRNCSEYKKITVLAERLAVPILSSRFSQDLFLDHRCYFGYIGSHGLRYSNFILSKTDCIIVLGNRFNVPNNSKTFCKIFNNARIIRVDIDENELTRRYNNSIEYCLNVNYLIPIMNRKTLNLSCDKKWFNICTEIKETLIDFDLYNGSKAISKIIETSEEKSIIVCDVGNNELLASRAFAISGKNRVILHSKSMKTVGSAIGKSIGAYYANLCTVICIVGDQGFQFNIQELQFISDNMLPIIIVVCNNKASGMLKKSESVKGYDYFIHTTIDSGYSQPSFEKIADTYSISYIKTHCLDDFVNNINFDSPCIVELIIDEIDEIVPFLPFGNPCNSFIPELDSELYDYLEGL